MSGDFSVGSRGSEPGTPSGRRQVCAGACPEGTNPGARAKLVARSAGVEPNSTTGRISL
jgi:hypothetical protein